MYRLPSIRGSSRSRSWVSGRVDSTPYCSATKRLSARIAIGPSTAPRRHATSHGAAHTRPQTEANGFGARATRYASSFRPSAISWTYRPASVATGHPDWHLTWAFQCSTTGREIFTVKGEWQEPCARQCPEMSPVRGLERFHGCEIIHGRCGLFSASIVRAWLRRHDRIGLGLAIPEIEARNDHVQTHRRRCGFQ